MKIPADLNYEIIPNLSTEIREKLNFVKPESIAAAAKISGITPVGIVNLIRYINAQKKLKVNIK